MATSRQNSKANTNKSPDYLMKIILNKHIEKRVEELKDCKKNYQKLIHQFQQDKPLLKAGSFDRIPNERIQEYRKLCSSLNLPDFIGSSSNYQANFRADNGSFDKKSDSLLMSTIADAADGVISIEDAKDSSWIILDKFTYDELLNLDDFNKPKNNLVYKEPKLVSNIFVSDEFQKEMFTPCSPSLQTFNNNQIKDSNFNQLNSPMSSNRSNTTTINELNRPSSPDLAMDSITSNQIKIQNKAPQKRERIKSITSDTCESDISGQSQSQAAVTMARRWRRNMMSALSTVCSHRYAHIFMQAVTDEIAPGYSALIYRPTDLTSIRKQVETILGNLVGGIQQPQSPANTSNPCVSNAQEIIIEAAQTFLRELLLMFSNARIYNSTSHEVFKMTCTMYHDVLCELKPIWQVLSDDIPMLPKLPPLNLEAAYSETATSHVPTEKFPTLERSHFREITGDASWYLSSCKPGHGINQLLDNDTETFWQSDGPQPHFVTAVFSKKTTISHLFVCCNWRSDESYTPNKVSIRIGNSINELYELSQYTLLHCNGWFKITLTHQNGERVRTWVLQLVVLSNYQSGRDTHIRCMRIFGPISNREVTTFEQNQQENAVLIKKAKRHAKVKGDPNKAMSTQAPMTIVDIR